MRLPLLLLLVLLCAQQHRLATAAVGGRGGGFGGGSRGSSVAAARPPQTYRPATTPPQSAMTRQPAPAGRAYGSSALPGGFSAYGRPGFRSTPLILPLTAGLLAGAAVTSLARDPSAYCNGRSLQCYKAACQSALNSQCPEAAAGGNATLVLSACPDSRYSECYRTQAFDNTSAASFECFGVRRPRYGREDVSAVCHQPGNMLTSGARGAGSGAGVLSLAAVLPLAVAVLLLCAL